MFKNKSIFVTGATGSFGQAFYILRYKKLSKFQKISNF